MRVRFAAWISFGLAWLAWCAPATAQAEAPRTLFLVRHAEKAAGENPALTAAGRERAQLLARMLRDARIRVIVVSEWKRTQQTAAPLAQALGIAPRIVRVDVPAKLRALAPGTRALVVSHSDVVPGIVAALGCGEIPAIGGREYDRLYLVTLEGDGDCEATLLRYGAPSAAGG